MSKFSQVLAAIVVISSFSSTLALENFLKLTFKETDPISKESILAAIQQTMVEPERQNSQKQPPLKRQTRSSVKPQNGDQSSDFLFENQEEVVSFIQSVMECKHVPALSVAVVKGTQTWTKGFGVRDVKTGVLADSGTLFGIGSVTKGFTAALLAIGVQEAQLQGKDVTWDTLVKDAISEDLELTQNLQVNVTMADVLAHRTGLMAADMMAVAGFPPLMTRAQFVRQLRFLPEFLPFRRMWWYNNWMYSLAGDVTEYLLGEPWEKLLKKRLLLPLGMEDSLLVWNDVNVTSSKMARPYHLIRGTLQEIDESLYELKQGRPSGSLAVSADDMAKWMKFMLQKGVLSNGGVVINERLMRDLTSSHIPVSVTFQDAPVGHKLEGYGFGWFTGSYRGLPTVSHTGGWFGYKCTLTLFPDNDTAVYVATSGPGTSAGSEAYRVISYFLSDLALGYSPWLNQSSACSFGEESETNKDDVETPDYTNMTKISNPDRYIGQYCHSLFGSVVIQNSTFYHGLVLHFGKIEGFLIPGTREFEFEVEFSGRTVWYSFNNFEVQRSRVSFSSYNMTEDGKSVSLVLRAPPPQSYERMEFSREEGCVSFGDVSSGSSSHSGTLVALFSFSFAIFSVLILLGRYP